MTGLIKLANGRSSRALAHASLQTQPQPPPPPSPSSTGPGAGRDTVLKMTRPMVARGLWPRLLALLFQAHTVRMEDPYQQSPGVLAEPYHRQRHYTRCQGAKHYECDSYNQPCVGPSSGWLCDSEQAFWYSLPHLPAELMTEALTGLL